MSNEKLEVVSIFGVEASLYRIVFADMSHQWEVTRWRYRGEISLMNGGNYTWRLEFGSTRVARSEVGLATLGEAADALNKAAIDFHAELKWFEDGRRS